MMLTHLAAHLYGVPLMINRPKLDTILAVLGNRIGLANTGTKPPHNLQELEDVEQENVSGIAVIPVYGTLVRRTLGLEAQSGLVSYTSIGTQIVSALADPGIKGVLLDFDSPGGEAGGAFDLSDAIYRSRGTKPIWALANDACFSAAYALASAADKVFVTRTGGIGSVGVVALHVDQSAADAKDGLAYNAVFAGAKKNDLSPHQPLANSARATLQTEVDRIYTLFTATVARNRACSAAYVAATDAALFFGPDAVASGLADNVASFAEVIAQLSQHISQPPAAMSALPSLVKEIHMQQTENVPATVADNPQPAVAAQSVAVVQSADAGPQYDHAVEIAQLCQLAGMESKTAEFLATGQTVAQVRQALLAAKASVPAISSHINPVQPPQPTDLVMKIVKQRLG